MASLLLQGRRILLLAVLLLGVCSYLALGLSLSDLVPNKSNLVIAKDFFSHAISPALSYEAEYIPPGTPPLLGKVLVAVVQTVIFAAAGISISIVLGLLLGFLSSTSWWARDPMRRSSALFRWRLFAGFVHISARILSTFMRSIHELLWAVLFLAMLGISNVSAVLAIAIPYSGVFAKIFSELIDEASSAPGDALRAAGAGQLEIFFLGRLPLAAADMCAYVLYRFECALRSSAVLGFFGFPTLGYFMASSFENLHYAEVWTYLYALFIVVVLLDYWSGALRLRLTK